jgi:hypothetical protein
MRCSTCVRAACREAEARRLLTGAFCREPLAGIDDARLREPCEAALDARAGALGA